MIQLAWTFNATMSGNLTGPAGAFGAQDKPQCTNLNVTENTIKGGESVDVPLPANPNFLLVRASDYSSLTQGANKDVLDGPLILPTPASVKLLNPGNTLNLANSGKDSVDIVVVAGTSS